MQEAYSVYLIAVRATAIPTRTAAMRYKNFFRFRLMAMMFKPSERITKATVAVGQKGSSRLRKRNLFYADKKGAYGDDPKNSRTDLPPAVRP